MRDRRTALAFLLAAALLPASISARQGGPAARPPLPVPLPNMEAIAADLGVDCAYCHTRGAAPAPSAGGKLRLDVAREMIVMTAELNTRVQDTTGRPQARVRCVTCHRGVAIPRQLQDIVWQTTMEQGHEAAVAQYRDLRTRYYGRQSYDFGEDTLLLVADRIAQTQPPAAIALARLNLEFFPRSARSYVTLAIAQSRTDLAEAIGTLKTALEMNPNDALARGRLFQWEEDLKRRQRSQQP